jgi:hypothetical protein
MGYPDNKQGRCPDSLYQAGKVTYEYQNEDRAKGYRTNIRIYVQEEEKDRIYSQERKVYDIHHDTDSIPYRACPHDEFDIRNPADHDSKINGKYHEQDYQHTYDIA